MRWPPAPGNPPPTSPLLPAAQHLSRSYRCATWARALDSPLELANAISALLQERGANTNTGPIVRTAKDAAHLLPSNFVPSPPPSREKQAVLQIRPIDRCCYGVATVLILRSPR